MHPIEHLRFLARSNDPSPEWLVPEAAEALRALARDRTELVLACRKLLERQPYCGPLWWLCGRVLLAPDVDQAIDDVVGAFDRDPTPLHVSLALEPSDGGSGADARPEPLLCTFVLAGPAGALVPASDPGVARLEQARADGTPVWLIGGVGRVVPGRIFDAVAPGTRASARSRTGLREVVEVVPSDLIDAVIGPSGVESVAVAFGRGEVPFVPELMPRG